jgi:hypothetical protein
MHVFSSNHVHVHTFFLLIMGKRTVHATPRKKSFAQVKTINRKKTRGGLYLYELGEISEDSDTGTSTPAPKKKKLVTSTIPEADFFEDGNNDNVPLATHLKKAPGVVSLSYSLQKNPDCHLLPDRLRMNTWLNIRSCDKPS